MEIELKPKDILEAFGFELVEWGWEKCELNDNWMGYDLVHKPTNTVVHSLTAHGEPNAWELIEQQLGYWLTKQLATILVTDAVIQPCVITKY